LADTSSIPAGRAVVSRSRRRHALPVLLAVLLASGALAACGASGDGGATKAADRVVATVDGRPVYQSQVDALLGEARLAGDGTSGQEALDGVIDEELLRGEAERVGATVPASEVERRIRDLEDQVGGPDALDEALAAVDLTRAQLGERLGVVALGERLAAVKFPGLEVTRAQALDYYRSRLFVFTRPAAVKLGEIKVRTEQMAQGAIKSVRDGRSFFETAKTFNRDPELKRVGGQLGWVSADTLPTPIAKAVAKLRPGQVSEPVPSFGGYDVLKLYARRPARTTPFAEVASEVREAALSQRRAAALRRWLDRARAEADIEILP